MATTIHAQDANPNRLWIDSPKGLEFRMPMPMWGPWYNYGRPVWPYGDPNRKPQDYFQPFGAGGVPNPYIPQWSGAFIQPRNRDTVAYDITQGSLDGLGSSAIAQVSATFGLMFLGAAVGYVISPRKRLIGTLAGAAIGAAIGRVGSHTKEDLKQTAGLKDFTRHLEDPTGGAYSGGGDPIYGDQLGPGMDIARSTRWAYDLKPRGFAATTV